MYTQDTLTARFYEQFSAVASKKTSGLVKPQIERKNRKTMITNYIDVCKSLNRDSEHIRKFFEDELRPEMSVSGESGSVMTVSISGDGILIIGGTYPPQIIMTIITKFIKKFVHCSTCESTNTSIVKEHKVTYLQCNFCKSKKPIG